ncbi:MAG: sugar transferase [Polyangiaceae bacterium]|nr:sugar transferase [Polyangiaceae bacterium]
MIPPAIERRMNMLPPALRGARPRRAAELRRFALRLIVRWMNAGPAVRRVVDVVGAGFGMLFIFPVLLGAAIAIKATSRGPVLFRQERIGKNGRRFHMLKLRTMRTDAEALKTTLAQAHGAQATGGLRFKMKRDPRITRVGAVLRKLSIDELPQLWNVVRGDMTLVGPRPAIWREVSLYDPRALRRLEVPQGLTCLWQIGGRSDLTFDEQVSLDIEYIDRVKPLDELKIVARTVPAVIKGKGAY